MRPPPKKGNIWKLQLQVNNSQPKYMAVMHTESPVNFVVTYINLLKPTGYVMHQQFNIQQFCVLPTLYLCVLYLSENKQRLVPLTA